MQAVALRSAKVTFTGMIASMSRDQAYELVRQQGGEPTNIVSRQTSYVVVGMEGWPILPDGCISNKLKRAEELIRRGYPLQIISERAFLEMTGKRDREKDSLQKTFPAAEVCKRLRLPSETLERWEQFGLVRSQDSLYDFQDLVSLRTITELVSRGVRPETIARSLSALEGVLPDAARPLAQLKIVVENSKALAVNVGDRLIAPSGQLLINFESAAQASAAVIQLTEKTSSEEWFAFGQECEADENYAEAEQAYRKAITMNPTFSEACFNLGNVLRLLGRRSAAIEAYVQATVNDPKMAIAWYNLADVQEEQGLLRDASESLQRALAGHPNYADAHFNLALCFEKLERRREAKRHWLAYLKLDPYSQWANVARRHLAGG